MAGGPKTQEITEMTDSALLTLALCKLSPTHVTRVLIPKKTILPTIGVWRRRESGQKITYILDTSQSRDGWLALATTGRVLWSIPNDWLDPVEVITGNDRDLFIGYARPGSWLLLYFKESGIKAPVRILPHK
jgi:hypothetical protein